jgi:predicted AlkP superfamily pyrophosphatase or phosphodiesterase
VNWPVTVGDRNIDYLLPEYWRTSTPDDLKLIRALSRPEGLLEALEKQLGPFVDGYADKLHTDETRTRFALALLRERRPHFTAVHLIALDGIQHELGPFVAPAFSTLEKLDGMIGELSAAAVSIDPTTVIAIVSDHGFIATHTAVNLRAAFVQEGLIKLKPAIADTAPAVESWDAQVWSGGAIAGIVLRDANDQKARERVQRLLDRLQRDARNGIAGVLSKRDLDARGSFPGADWLVELAPGFLVGNALRGDLLTPTTTKGMHGYLPERPEMHASFFVRGANIAQARNLGIIDMRQIAPTLASVLVVELPTAQQPALAVMNPNSGRE